MPLSFVPVTGPVLLPDGSVPVGGRVIFTLSGYDTEAGIAVDTGPVSRTLDATGNFTAALSLWRNSRGLRGRHYSVTLVSESGAHDFPDIQTGEDASYTFAALIDLPVPTAPGFYPVADIPAEVFSGTTYTLVAADKGKAKESSNGSAVTVTLPNSLPAGFSCLVMQGGAGQITFAAASGATPRQALGLTKTYAQYSEVCLRVRANATGTAAEWVLSGDMV